MEAVIASPNKEQMLNELLDEILQRQTNPEDRYEIAATLEAMGWNDERAARIFGVEDVFALASDLWEKSSQKILFQQFAKVEKMGVVDQTVALIRTFLRGLIFALPMAVSVFSMLTLKFSLWSYENLSVELATSIAIGTILSFITVGGFTQAIARRGFFYIIQGYFNMARRVTFHFIGLGFLVCLAFSVLILLVNFIVEIFPYSMLLMIILYFFFLNTIWLSVTVMYILKKELVFTGLIIAGIFIVFLLFDVFQLNIIVSQLIALSLVSGASLLLVIYFFKKAEKKEEKGIVPQLPKMSVTLYSTLPYFIYGVLYFSFLYVDRIMAWSTNDTYMPYLIWFRGDYELGLDFSLLVLIIPMGLSEVILTKLMSDIETAQKSTWGDETAQMNRTYLAIYFRRIVLIGAVSVVCAIGLYFLTLLIFNHFTLSIGQTLFSNGVTHFVYLASLGAYVLLAVGLTNAVILFSLSQPELVIRPIWISFLVNVIAGFLLSRWIHYSFSAVGLFVGAMLFVILSSRNVTRVLNKLDYYLYAAS